MLKKLLGAAAMAAAAYAFVPAHAAAAGLCSGDSQAKAQGQVQSMADGPAKFMAQSEIARAQTAFLAGNMGECAMHLSNAMNARMAPPAYPGAYAQAPYPEAYAEAPYPEAYAQPYPGRYPRAAYRGTYPQRAPYATTTGPSPY